MSPALAGGFLTTVPPGKSPIILLISAETIMMIPLSLLILVICVFPFLLDHCGWSYIDFMVLF